MLRCFIIFVSLFLIPAITNAQEIIRYNGSSTILKAIMYEAAKEFKSQEGILFDLKGNNTTYGIQKLLEGKCDIAGGGRPLNELEKEKGLVETKVFLDAYAFIIHKSNPVKEITSVQISDILKGKLNRWNDLGGPKDKNIFIVSPPEKSMHYKNAKKIIGFKELPQNSMKADMAPHVYKKVKSFPLSFGWLSYANVTGTDNVKILKVIKDENEAEITQADLISGRYPYQQTMFLYTMGQPQGNNKKFINFLKSNKGRAIIKQAGFFNLE